VLEEVGEAAASAGLETEAYLVVDADGDDWGAAVGGSDYSQTVGEGGVLDWDV
jgi:hypothetical protein